MPRTRQERRPVTGEHPCIAAAVAVLEEAGGPLAVSEIFARAHERGLLPESSHNTIRGRFSAHQQLPRPLIAPLPRRQGWILASGRRGPVRGVAHGHSLRERVVTGAWLRRKHAPEQLARLVEAVPDGKITVRSLLLRALDVASLAWLVYALPFRAGLRDRLLRARGVQGRTAALNAEERAERVARRPRRAG